jgi:thiamine-phosphate pyrophosphorylase
MKVALYTPPGVLANETYHLSTMLDMVDYVFLRKEGIDDVFWDDYVQEIPLVHASKVMTSYYRVLHEYDLGGFHFRSGMLDQMNEAEIWENINMLRNKGKKSSATAHNLEQLKLYNGKFDIVLVAPLFESISKPGHSHVWDFEAIKNILKDKSPKTEVFALGGIDASKVDMVHLLGFDGIALLGSIWKGDPYLAKEHLEKIISAC